VPEPEPEPQLEPEPQPEPEPEPEPKPKPKPGPKPKPKPIKADISYDIWSFGVMVYKLCTKGGLAHLYNEDHGELVNEHDQAKIANGWQTRKLDATARINSGRDDKTWDAARDLALWCLQERPERRPQSFEQVLEHPFLKCHSAGKLRFEGTDDERATKLHRAVEDGETATAKSILERGGVPADVLVHASGAITPLHRAARKRDLDMLQLLLDEGADVNAQSKYGHTCIHWAVEFGHEDILEMLLKQPACDPAAKNDRGMTAWAMARAVRNDGPLSALHSIFDRISKGIPYSSSYFVRIFPTQVRQKLQSERKRFEKRPDVADNFRDNTELDSERFDLWAIEVGSFMLWYPFAEGGFGKVFKVSRVSPAIQVSDGDTTRRFSEVAVKAPKPHGIKELKSEVESLAQLTHVNVVQILGMFRGPAPTNAKEDWKMAMEFCPTSLQNMLYASKALEHQDHNTGLMVEFAEQIMTGLTYIHSQGKRHLDLKPENILLSKDGGKDWVCKIGDFGMQYEEDNEKNDSQPFGTWEYMSPECRPCKTERVDKPGDASDIFSFGIMFWEMIARKRPYKAFTGFEDDECAPTKPVYKDGKTTYEVNVQLIDNRLAKGERPGPSPRCPKLLYLLMQACWVPAMTQRPSLLQLQAALKDIVKTPGSLLDLLPEPPPPPEPLTYDGFLRGLELEHRKEELAEYLADGKELTELKQMDEDALNEDILDDLDDFDDETKERFRKAVKELKSGPSALAEGDSVAAANGMSTPWERLSKTLGDTTDAKLTQARTELEEARQDLEQLKEERKQLEEEREGMSEELKRTTTRKDELQADKDELQADKNELQADVKEREAELRVAKAELVEMALMAELSEARSDHHVLALKAELSEAKHVAIVLEGQVEKDTKTMAKVGGKLVSSRAEKERVQAKKALDSLGNGQIHVRGVGGQFEAEAAIIGVFARFGPVVQATVRHRIDKATGANTSWALVTMRSRESAEAVLAAASSLPTPLTVSWFSKEQADSSHGQMGVVRREAAVKMIQSSWRRQLAYRAYRDALMKERAQSTIVGLTDRASRRSMLEPEAAKSSSHDRASNPS
jgi:serine/threonine protein kinase